jgi:hypothetical protein
VDDSNAGIVVQGTVYVCVPKKFVLTSGGFLGKEVLIPL